MTSPSGTDHRAPRPLVAATAAAALLAISVTAASATHGDTHVTLEPDTTGCNGVLPSRDGNTDMRLVGGTLQPGGTAIFEITYPVNAGSVGKEFTILDCAFIDGVAALKYTVTFVPSNQDFVLFMALGVPSNAPVGGQYCNYAKTTGSPTAAQGSQRKAGPACFTIRAPATAAPPAAPAPNAPPPNAPAPNAPAPNAPAAPSGGGAAGGTPGTRGPTRLPDTAAAPATSRGLDWITPLAALSATMTSVAVARSRLAPRRSEATRR